MNYCLHHKCSDLPEAKSDTWAAQIAEEFSVKSETPSISSLVAPGSQSAQSQFEVTDYPDLSLQRCMTSAPILRNSLRKHTLEIYACLFCDKTFNTKGNWKRHEGSLHEPQKQWLCLESGCNRKFTAGNKFRQHHQRDHGCENCQHDTDTAVMSTTQTTSSWGCGFCIALLTTWDDRANHIALHFEAGKKKSDWDFSRVIKGLLRQPKVLEAWESLVLRNHGPSWGPTPQFEWAVESSRELLRSLQCANPEQSAINIAQSAYNLGLRTNSGKELNTISCYDVLYSFLEPAAGQEFLVDTFEPGDSLPTLSNPSINGSEAFQLGQSLGTPATVSVDDAEAYDNLLEDSCVVDEEFQLPKDYTTPCPETFEPAAWTLWPNSNLAVD